MILKPKRSLGHRLILSYILISLLIIGLTVIAVNGYLNLQFTRYLRATVEERNTRIRQNLETVYTATSDWGAVAQTAASIAATSNLRIVVRDVSGLEVIDTSNLERSIHGRMMRRWMPGMSPEQSTFLKPYNLMSNGETVGKVLISMPQAYTTLTRLDSTFRTSITAGSLIASLAALLVASGLGLYIARQITRPLSQLTGITQQYTKGDFSQRSEVAGQDELGQLAESFNAMADQLQKQEANRRKLTADIFHEINTPLMAARSLIEGMQDGILPADHSNLQAINDELIRLGNLVSDVRALSIAESGKLHLTMEDITLQEILSSVQQRWRQAFADKGLLFEIHSPDHPVVISADTKALFQILSNLLSNALKYSEAGSHVEVNLLESAETVTLAVKDTGRGIPAEDLPSIFERFYRGQNAKDTGAPGTGVGLAITKELVEANNAKIVVASELGAGTEFTIVFRRGGTRG